MLVNGTPDSTISLDDRGLNYGDGLFETLAVVDGRPCLWRRHMTRLAHGCSRLGIPEPDTGQLLAECLAVARGRPMCAVKIVLTRGQGGRGYRPAPKMRPNRIVRADPWEGYPESARQRGVALRVCSTRLGSNPALAGIKHLNRLEQVLARSEWSDPDILEGIMLDGADNMVECTMSNLFVLRKGRLVTPPVRQCGVAGVVRGVVIDTAVEMGLNPIERTLPRSKLEDCEALFITNSLMGALPVRRVDEREFEVAKTEGSLSDLIQRVRRRAFQPDPIE